MAVSYGFHRLHFPDLEKANDILETMKMWIRTYGFVTLQDFHIFAGIVPHFLDQVSGWRTLKGVEVKVEEDDIFFLGTFYIDLPKPGPLT